MASDFAKKLIKENEGLRLKPYRCTSGKLTIGYGRNLDDRGISVHEANELFENDLVDAEIALGNIFGLEIFKESEGRVAVLLSMAFNLGEGGLQKFKLMNEAIKQRDWIAAAEEAKNSLWFSQVGSRSVKIIQLLKGEQNGF